MTEGEEVFFAVKVNGQPQPTLIWYCDGKEIQSDYSQEIKTDGSLSFPSTETRQTGPAPLPKTLVDFWRLVWQEKPPIIVLVTNLKEGNKVKCQQYWPEAGTNEFGPFKVIITDQQAFADYVIRVFTVSVSCIVCVCFNLMKFVLLVELLLLLAKRI